MASIAYRDEKGNRHVKHGLELVEDGALVGAPDLDGEEVAAQIELAEKRAAKKSATSDESTVDRDDWRLVSTPEQYLARSPKGPQAKLAQQMIDAGLGDVSAADEEDEDDENDED